MEKQISDSSSRGAPICVSSVILLSDTGNARGKFLWVGTPLRLGICLEYLVASMYNWIVNLRERKSQVQP
jgi:hypothetical protein